MLYWNYYMDNPAKSQRLVGYCCRGWCRPGAVAAVAGMCLYTDWFVKICYTACSLSAELTQHGSAQVIGQGGPETNSSLPLLAQAEDDSLSPPVTVKSSAVLRFFFQDLYDLTGDELSGDEEGDPRGIIIQVFRTDSAGCLC